MEKFKRGDRLLKWANKGSARSKNSSRHRRHECGGKSPCLILELLPSGWRQVGDLSMHSASDKYSLQLHHYFPKTSLAHTGAQPLLWITCGICAEEVQESAGITRLLAAPSFLCVFRSSSPARLKLAVDAEALSRHVATARELRCDEMTSVHPDTHPHPHSPGSSSFIVPTWLCMWSATKPHQFHHPRFGSCCSPVTVSSYQKQICALMRAWSRPALNSVDNKVPRPTLGHSGCFWF